MSRSRQPLAIAALATLMSCTTPAAADEAYICDAGRIVYVKHGELEHLKRTDPCIAGYYGLTVESPANSGDGKPAKPEQKPAKTSNATDKVPSAAARPDIGSAEKGLVLERNARAEPKNRGPEATRPQPAGKSASAAHVGKQQSPGRNASPDFRNVIIINAAPGTEPVYRHVK